MRMRMLVLFSLLFVTSVRAAEILVDDFDSGIEKYSPFLQYGKVDKCKASLGQGVKGTKALRIDFDLEGQDTNHVMFIRDVDLDLSWCDKLAFEVKGTGDQVLVFLFLYDSQGRFNNYGPHGTNGDFHTGYADWRRCEVTFERDRSVQGGGVDLGDIKRLGFFLWSMGPKKGTAWFDNLRADEGDRPADLKLSPATFSPNGDGVNDSTTLTTYVPRDSRLTLDVVNSTGTVVLTLVGGEPQEHRRKVLTWDSFASKQRLPDGEYTVRARCTGTTSAEVSAKMKIDTSHKWPAISYTNKPFFPIGVWFEGAPSISGCPTNPQEAKKWYDRCFADLSSHGFNTAAVPNCPESLWESLLQSAQEHRMKICLEVGPLVELVSRLEPPTEREASETITRVVKKIGKCRSLLRYQIRDEPPAELVSNWRLVQRILAAVDPKRPSFSCFCDPGSLARLTSQTRMSEAVFDIYPLWTGTPRQTLGNFLPSLDTFKGASRDNPSWAVLQAFAITHAPGSWRYPTPEELRAMTYLSLASGVKGVFYFIYSHMPGYLDGMVAKDGAVQPIYAPTAALARELQKLSPLLLSLKPAQEPPKVDDEARAGAFTNRKGQRVLILANMRPDAAITVKVQADDEGRYRDALSGEEFAARNGALEVPLAAGGGRALVGQSTATRGTHKR